MINFLILNWIAGLISGFILLLGAFFISSAIDKLEGGLKMGIFLIIASTFLFAILSFIMSIQQLQILSQISSSDYIWQPYLFLFGAICFALGAKRFHYELKKAEDFTWGKKKLLSALKKSSGKKLKYDFNGGL